MVFVAAKIFFELYRISGRVLEMVDKDRSWKKQAEQED